MGEGFRSPERGPESKEVHEELQPLTLKEQLLDLYPERCRNGNGSRSTVGMVCQKIGGFVGELIDNVEEGTMTYSDALATASANASVIEETCNAPFQPSTSNSFKCGADASNFFESTDRLSGYR